MITLAIDTASINCAVAIIKNGVSMARVCETLSKGHAEKLIGEIIAATKEAKVSLSMIDRIAVNIGPGSFTGVRIGVATARALALALQKPAIGVSSLEAIAFEANNHFQKNHVIALIDAGRNMVYRQDFDENLRPIIPAKVQNSKDVIETIDSKTVLAGPFAETIGKMAGQNDNLIFVMEAPDVISFALLSEKKTPDDLPKPLYLRGADAKPQMGFALPRKKE